MNGPPPPGEVPFLGEGCRCDVFFVAKNDPRLLPLGREVLFPPSPSLTSRFKTKEVSFLSQGPPPPSCPSFQRQINVSRFLSQKEILPPLFLFEDRLLSGVSRASQTGRYTTLPTPLPLWKYRAFPPDFRSKHGDRPAFSFFFFRAEEFLSFCTASC